ncbi:unnamed protein product [Allacma fusca]|uniref:Uncharacterized protein n=1 Tax=Allacma fusca TaxID=39272 RepID=A0A8J2KG53_9HEXA|nr:unnamed protein product [Allacma fusca]
MQSSFQSLKKSMAKNEELDVTMYGNLVMGKVSLRSFYEIETYIGNAPDLTKQVNGSKGCPINYIAISLDKLQNVINMRNTNKKELIKQDMYKEMNAKDVERHKFYSDLIADYNEQQDILKELTGYLHKATSYADILPLEEKGDVKAAIQLFVKDQGMFGINKQYLLKDFKQSGNLNTTKYRQIQQTFQDDRAIISVLRELRSRYEEFESWISHYLWLTKLGVYYLKTMNCLVR